MKNQSKQISLWVIALTSPLLALRAAPAPPSGSSRVYINFTPGQKGLAKALVAQSLGTVHYEFDELSAISATVPEAALAGFQNNPNITLVEADPPRYLYAESYPYGIKMVGATELWDANLDYLLDPLAPTGSGIKIGVIDSGVFAGHQDFVGVSMSGYPGGGDSTRWDHDGLKHGTHVSGTLAAALNGVGVTGVSPGKVSLYMVRVFGDSGEWIYSSSLLDAANRCYNAGARIISMSLGGPSYSSTEDNGFSKLYDKGVLNVAAAGNSGSTAIRYPAGHSSVISVAAIDSNKNVAGFSQHNPDVELAAPGVGVKSTVSWTQTNTVTAGTKTYSGKHIQYSARGIPIGPLVDGGRATSTNIAWLGMVVLVERGDISLSEKVKNVENSGGVACVVYNNVSGGFSGTLGFGNASTIPAISISQADGVALMDFCLNENTTVTSILTEGGYGSLNGTSMATPQVAGVAALIWSAAPTKTNAQVRKALQAAAEDLGEVGRDPYYGYGLVQAASALTYLVNN